MSNKKSNYKNQTSKYVRNINWNFFSMLKYFKTRKSGIFFIQYSPFNLSRTGFSFSVILLLIYLNFFKKNIKIFTNFHEIRNKFSIQPKYFLIFALQTLQFYFVFYLSKKIYFTNKVFLKDLPILKSKKSKYLKIFSTLEWVKVNKKNQVIFFSSHFNYYKYEKFFQYIKYFQLQNKKKFNIIFLGNTSNEKFKKLKQLLKKYNLKNVKIISNLTKKKLAYTLSKNKIIMITNEENFKLNSSFIVSAITTRNCLFFLNKKKFSPEVSQNFFSVYNQKMFNKKISLILSKPYDFFQYKSSFLKNYEINYVIKNFIKDFYSK